MTTYHLMQSTFKEKLKKKKNHKCDGSIFQENETFLSFFFLTFKCVELIVISFLSVEVINSEKIR